MALLRGFPHAFDVGEPLYLLKTYHMSSSFTETLQEILASNLFHQLAPLVVLLVFPLIVLNLVAPARRLLGLLTSTFVMVLETLGLSLPWHWSWSGNGGADADKRKHKKRHPRTRTEQIAMNGIQSDPEEADYYPGLVNISGTYCFMNSTLQAMSSLSYLQPHIDRIHSKAVELDVPSPVIDALRDLFDQLNTPLTRPSSLRPLQVIQALTNGGKANTLLHSREHQDAQELFQLITESLKNEISAMDKEKSRDRGLALSIREDMTSLPEAETSGGEWTRQSVFDGLTANRRSCMQCGYTEAVMHFAFDSWQLSVPHFPRCSLEELLEDYTRLEILHDCICRKCSLVATHRRLISELKTLDEALKGGSSSHSHAVKPGSSTGSHFNKLTEANGNSPKKPSGSKKRRAKEVAKMELRVRTALEEGRVEDDLKDVRMEKVVSRASSKQAMIARPPPVLALHLNRSSFGHYASKNNAFIEFPEILDITPYTTSGCLSTTPSSPISTPPPSLPIQLALPPRSRTPTPAAYEKVHERVLYRLSAVVCHYGSHSFGHYVCFRRKPRPKGAKRRWAPPTILDPLATRADDEDVAGGRERGMNGSADSTDSEEVFGKRNEIVWADEDPANHRSGRGWLRISDDSVRECGIESVLREGSGAFMLYYERIRFAHTSPYPSMAMRRSHSSSSASGLAINDMHMLVPEGEDGYSPRSSEETLRPELRTLQLNMVNGMFAEGNGSTQSLVSEVGVGIANGKGKEIPKRVGTENGNGHGNGVPIGTSGSLGVASMWTPGSSPPGMGPRVIRSVAAGRGKSFSAASSDAGGSRESSTTPGPTTNSITSPTKGKAKASEPTSTSHSTRADTSSSHKLPTKRPLQPPSLASSVLSVSPSSSILGDDLSSMPLHSPQPHHPPSPIVGLKA
ncbi:hypothetical protein PLEOSDRAFT_1112327 [Pleurotus ostreatus PC15]|uniref:ubiquitinyl hydrolase 1 n=1 Tax=Pleurotus ostreatus (strain PC15) TaxID=1137138 RepID=A0A067NZG1_PLEO1|nr:hypothetical protein PLEOSDRAFT_1112327 [Pleurotus ostreatus PC15]